MVSVPARRQQGGAGRGLGLSGRRSGDGGGEGRRRKKMVSVPARRQQVAYGRELGLSARRACTLFSVARSTLKYRSRKATKGAPRVERMPELSAQYPPSREP